MKTLLLFLGLLSVSIAQDSPSPAPPAAAPEPPPPAVNIKFTVVGWGQPVTDLAYKPDGTLKPLGPVPLFTRSKPLSYQGPATLLFYRKPARPGATPGAEATVVATALIPPALKRAMILLSPQGDHYQAMVVPDDLDAIPGGQALITNLCPDSLAIRTNKTNLFTLAPGESKLVSPAAKSLLLLQMEVGIHETAGWKKSDDCFLPLPLAYQTMIFFLTSDSRYFKDIDGHILKPTQMIVLREPVESHPKANLSSNP